MKNNIIYKKVSSNFILLSAFILSSCAIDVDTSDSSKTLTTNPVAGLYMTRGSMYNYSGQTSPWAGPPSSLSLTDSLLVPPGYISRIDLSPFSPKTATVIDSLSITISFANFVIPDYYYYWKMNPSYTSIAVNISPTMLAGYSNISIFIRAFVLPSPSQKLSVRIITHYNDQLTGVGNDHIVDEVFVQK